MARYTTVREVAGPWSLATSRTFWEGFAPAALPSQGDGAELRTVPAGRSPELRRALRLTEERLGGQVRFEDVADEAGLRPGSACACRNGAGTVPERAG